MNLSENKQTGFSFSKPNWPENIEHKTLWFYSQDELSFAVNTITDHANQPTLK